ncbi:uncharacterized protein LOC108744238 [Agrilus planipennis]|uniref:Uncharacterized protein LOC108744238 n=1 Tax=Agrilus planipennis TaxID=224129 RepID=A0A1W4XSG3_AGRPL|nr:uncharacterized protein LOC108744238 [Agrilus planipennis]
MTQKNEIKIRKLSEVTGVPSEKSNTPEALKKLMEFVPNFDVDSDDSDTSEIADLFEQFHKDSFLVKRPGQKRLKKDEAAKMTMKAFTNDYKRVMEELRKEQQIGDNMVYEDPNDDFAELKKLKTDFQQFEEIEKLPVNGELIAPQENCQQQCLARNDFISDMWSLLERHREDQKFVITPPWYDAYRQEQPHWSERPFIAWSVVDEAKQKCEKWLKKIEEDKNK